MRQGVVQTFVIQLLFLGSMGVSFYLFVLLYEEPHLKKIFGTSYDEYRTRGGRWLPTIRREVLQGSRPPLEA